MKKKNIIIAVILIIVLAAVVFIAIRITLTNISTEEAQSIALKHAGISKEDAAFTQVKHYDNEYKIGFDTSDDSYEYVISDFNGDIKEYEKKSIKKENTVNSPLENETAPTAEENTQEIVSDNVVSDSNKTKLTMDEILSVAYKYAGIDSKDVVQHKIEFDDGVYEVDFEALGHKYECKLSIYGKVIEFEKK